jgi:hypothetical protein
LLVRTPGGAHSARTITDAEHQAHRAMGMILRRAERPGVPWGLLVEVGSVRAVYGEWPLLPGPGAPATRERSPVVMIRGEWRDGDGSLKALDNAMRIVHAYIGRRLAA